MEDNETTYIVWLDNTLLMLGSFILMAFMMMALINPPKPTETTAGTPLVGTMLVEILWADKIDVDIDLWVQAPGDKIIGYSNKGGVIFNLLRDDLGRPGDTLDLNYEVAYTRGLPEGEYVINVHLYRLNAVTLPLDVKAKITVQDPQTKLSREIAQKTITLTKPGQELTVFRFRMDSKGNLVAGTMNDIQKPLRSAK